MLQVEMIEDAAVIRLRSGRLEVEGGQALERCYRLMAGSRVILDLSAVELLGSVAMSVLLSFSRQVRGCGGELRLSGLRGECLRTMRIVGLTSVFDIFPDIRSAISRNSSEPLTAST